MLVKNHLLNVVGRLVANEQVLGCAILIALNYLVFEAQELQNLLEHCGHDRTLRSERLGDLTLHLLRIHLNRLGTVSELLELSENFLDFKPKFLLQKLQGLLVVQFSLCNNFGLIPKELVDLSE